MPGHEPAAPVSPSHTLRAARGIGWASHRSASTHRPIPPRSPNAGGRGAPHYQSPRRCSAVSGLAIGCSPSRRHRPCVSSPSLSTQGTLVALADEVPVYDLEERRHVLPKNHDYSIRQPGARLLTFDQPALPFPPSPPEILLTRLPYVKSGISAFCFLPQGQPRYNSAIWANQFSNR